MMDHGKHAPILQRTYDQQMGTPEGVKIMERIKQQWGGLDGPQVGDMVTLVELFGYQRPCCEHDPEERHSISKEWIGKTVEVGIEHRPAWPGMCVTCEACGNHHHMVDFVFKYGITLPGEQEGIIVGIHEIAPMFHSWDLDGIELDPAKEKEEGDIKEL